MIGRTLDHYRIESKLGEGGMGAVYLAHDTRLKRPVAIKVLHAEAVANPERKRRFVQEAQAASALNHPNIITIYDISSAEGVDFIAMEYVEGQTLDRVIDRRGLPLGEALKYAIQIADALAKAHNAGIVHRDLKPANIMVTGEGLVKVLDFGLAKLAEPEVSDESAATLSMTREDRPHTEEGVILGTVAYMSPEQAQGKRVEARSDIFSFGSVLYEMFTGRRPFQGETKISTLSAILNKEPSPMSEISEGVPRQAEWIVAQCLRKDPAKRSQHMEDVKVALGALKEESDSGRLAVGVPAGARRSAATGWRAVAVGALALAVVAVGLGWWIARKESPRGGGTLTRLTADSGLTTDPALSPDGKLVAYASDRSGGNLDIWVQQVAGGEPIRLTSDPADEDEPSFSPDGAKIAFHSERESGSGPGVYVVSALGGEARLVAKAGRGPRFSPDGAQIAYWVGLARGSPSAPDSGRIFVVPAEGGSPRQIQPGFEATRYPVWAPDGKRLLFLGQRDSRASILENYDWWIAPVEAGPATKTGVYEVFRKLAPLEADPPPFTPAAWRPDPDGILFAGSFGPTRNIWRVGLSSRTGKMDGAPQQLTFGTGIETQPSAVSGPSGRTRLLFAGLQSNRRAWTLGLDANQGKVTGQLQPITQSDAAGSTLKLTPDGKKLAFASLQFRSGKNDIWLHDLETGKSVALTATPANEDYPVLSPDGSKAAYWIFAAEKAAIYSIDTRGGVPEKICEDCGAPWDWSSDGKRILYYWANRRRVGLLDTTSGEKIELLQHPKHTLAHPRFSLDGRWIAFIVRTGANRARVAVAPFRRGIIPESDWILLTDDSGPIVSPCWSPDGARIYFASERDGFSCIWQQRLDAATKRPLGPPSAVHHFHNARSALVGLSVARDKAAFTIVETTGNLWMSEF